MYFYFYHDLEVNDLKIAKLLCRNQCCHFDQTKKMCSKLEYRIISSLNVIVINVNVIVLWKNLGFCFGSELF